MPERVTVRDPVGSATKKVSGIRMDIDTADAKIEHGQASGTVLSRRKRNMGPTRRHGQSQSLQPTVPGAHVCHHTRADPANYGDLGFQWDLFREPTRVR
jgi:hypothetical protein